MAQPPLTLSLQFEREPEMAAHRNALPRSQVIRYIRAALFHPGEIAVRIVGLDEGRRLNREFRAKDYATNVLTFDYSRPPETPVVMADLVLCAPVVAQEAQHMGISLQAHYAHLLVHGALHAQGYDHEEDALAEQMEALEVQVLARLGFNDPYKKARP